LYSRELHPDRERNQKNNLPMLVNKLVNSYNRLRVANPGPDRLLGGFREYAEVAAGKPGCGPRVGKPARPTTAHCRRSVRTGYAQTRLYLATPSCNAILQRHSATRSHAVSLFVHLLCRGGLPNPFRPSWPSSGTFDAAKNGTFDSTKAGGKSSADGAADSIP
jgi:hypothetical protein